MDIWSDIRRGRDLLLEGAYNEGFRLLDRWRDLPDRAASRAPDLQIAPWRGGAISDGRILVWGEEGYGDQIMFARFAKLAPAPVVWMCAPPLVRLFRTCGGLEAASTAESVELSDIGGYSPSSALPLAFDLSAGPPNSPYLEPPPARPVKARIGVVTSGNPKHENDARRSLDAASSERLLNLPGAMSLQPWDTGAEDFYDTAAIVAGLDVVISVDTAIAHLAGAMGRPVWILLPHEPDWRWKRVGEDSDWYPSARLLRQARPGDWSSVIDQIEESLR